MTTRPLDGEILPPERRGPAAGEYTHAPPGARLDADEGEVRRGFWRTLRRAARQVPFTHELVGAYYCAIDPRVPFRVRAALLGALAYFVAPFDALPDLVPGIGFSDDATVLIGVIGMVAAHITPAHRERARQALEE